MFRIEFMFSLIKCVFIRYIRSCHPHALSLGNNSILMVPDPCLSCGCLQRGSTVSWVTLNARGLLTHTLKCSTSPLFVSARADMEYGITVNIIMLSHAVRSSQLMPLNSFPIILCSLCERKMLHGGASTHLVSWIYIGQKVRWVVNSSWF